MRCTLSEHSHRAGFGYDGGMATKLSAEDLQQLRDDLLDNDIYTALGDQSSSRRGAKDQLEIYDRLSAQAAIEGGGSRVRYYRSTGGFRGNRG